VLCKFLSNDYLYPMKYFLCLFFCLFFSLGFSQKLTESETIRIFFEAFHKKDTLTLKTLCHKDLRLQSVLVTKDTTILKSETVNDFFKQLTNISPEVTFEEKILNILVTSSDSLAQVWVPYEFYINGNLSHTGVNAFQLVKAPSTSGLQWYILHLMDSRIKPD
jgi:hypothetical protein